MYGKSCLHLPNKSQPSVGKYTIHGSYMSYTSGQKKRKIDRAELSICLGNWSLNNYIDDLLTFHISLLKKALWFQLPTKKTHQTPVWFSRNFHVAGPSNPAGPLPALPELSVLRLNSKSTFSKYSFLSANKRQRNKEFGGKNRFFQVSRIPLFFHTLALLTFLFVCKPILVANTEVAFICFPVFWRSSALYCLRKWTSMTSYVLNIPCK